MATEATKSAHAVFANRNFIRYQMARASTTLALEMQFVAVGWQVYEITREPLSLGLVGLAQFLPAFALFLISGQVIDLFPRERVLLICYFGFAFCSALLALFTVFGVRSMPAVYTVLVGIGAVRSFHHATASAFLPQTVPPEMFPTAVAWQSSFNQIANISGPAIGGIVYAIFHGPLPVYVAAVCSA